MTDIVLKSENITKSFGAVVAVDSVSFEMEKGELRALIGPNGAGKTTLFNLITGSLEPTSGDVYLKGDKITDSSPADIVEKGIVRSFQITNVFEGFSVAENVQVALVARDGQGWNAIHNMGGLTKYKDEALTILERVGLQNKAEEKAEELSHGEKRALEIAIVLARNPEILLLDEPFAGMSQVEIEELLDLIESLAEEFTILLVEHNMDVVMSVADTVMVLHNGELLADGSPEFIQQSKNVQEAYLGGEV